jgi:hypothetical protein
MVFGIEFGSNVVEQFSIFIAISGIITYYFGKLISDTKPQKEVRSVSYIEGFSFLVVLVIIPSIIIYYFNQQTFVISFLKPYWWLLLIFEYILAYFLYLKWSYFTAQLYELKRYVHKIYKQKVDEVMQKKLGFLQKYSKTDYTYFIMNWFQNFMESKMSNLTLFLISTLLILSTLVVIMENPSILYVALSGTSLFFGLSSLAILYGYYTAQFPYIKITLKNGKIKSGKIIKYDDGFFIIIDKGRKYFLNKDEIISVETPILLKQTKIK